MFALFSSSFFGQTFSLSCHLHVRRIIVVQSLFLGTHRSFPCLQELRPLPVRLWFLWRPQPVRRQLHLCLRQNLPGPVFLAAVVNAVKVALGADKTSASLDVATALVSMPEPSSSSSWRVSGGVPSQHMDLGVHTTTFLTLGVGFLRPNQPCVLQHPKVGIIIIIVPSFISTFVAPRSADTSSVISLS